MPVVDHHYATHSQHPLRLAYRHMREYGTRIITPATVAELANTPLNHVGILMRPAKRRQIRREGGRVYVYTLPDVFEALRARQLVPPGHGPVPDKWVDRRWSANRSPKYPDQTKTDQ